jgi:dTDP-4-dehydrorhamnose reductase
MVGLTFQNTIITGGAGTVASCFPYGRRLTKKELDVTKPKEVIRVLFALKPKLVIHTAALTQVDFCETHPQTAYEVNTLGTYHLAQVTAQLKATLVVISSGAVFPGTSPAAANDTPRPINVYGRTKYAAELIAKDCNPKTLIVRSGWIFGHSLSRKKFVDYVLDQIRTSAPTIYVLEDQSGCPTYAADFNHALVSLLKNPKPGIYHLVNRGVTSRVGLAREIVKLTGSRAKVVPAPASRFGLKAPRPKHEVLIPSGPALRPWRTALSAYLKSVTL